MADFLNGTCSVTNGSNVVTLDGGLNASFVTNGTAIFIDGLSPVQCLSGDVGTITLFEVWGGSNLSNVPFTTINTVEGLDTAISRARTAADELVVAKEDFDDFINNLPMDIDQGGTGATTAPQAVTNLGFTETAAAISASVSSTSIIEDTFKAIQSADFEANSAVGDIGISGFKYMGNGDSARANVNEGIHFITTVPNAFYMGRDTSNQSGVSPTAYPVLRVSGSEVRIDQVNQSSTFDLNKISLPQAPDGLTSSVDGSQYADLAAAIVAGGTSLSASVINRYDLVGVEVWDELISAKDIVVPYGNVQFGTSSYEGVSLVDLDTIGVAQGYSAMYEGDTSTQGKGVTWSTLSDADKETFLSDSRNNIRNTADGLVQRRYRARSIAGLEGDNWNVFDGSVDSLGFDTGSGTKFVEAQGSSETSPSWFTSGTNYYNPNSNTERTINDEGFYEARSDNTVSYNGFCVFIPVSLVTRRNQGAGHPEFNPLGCALFRNFGNNANLDWHQDDYANSLADCMDLQPSVAGKPQTTTGAIGQSSGNIHGDLFYDAIYADDIEDLRIDASGNWTQQSFLEFIKRRSHNGTESERNSEYLPFTRIYSLTSGGTGYLDKDLKEVGSHNIANNRIEMGTDDFAGLTSGDTVYVVDKTTGQISERVITALTNNYCNIRKRDGTGSLAQFIDNGWVIFPERTNIKSHYWTEVTGNPVRIAATYPDGVYAAWIPFIPEDNKEEDVPLSRKYLSGGYFLGTDDNGDTWGSVINRDANTNNTITFGSNPNGSLYVNLIVYKYTPNFTESASQVRVDYSDWEVVSSNCHLFDEGNTLTQSVLGKVATNSSGKFNDILVGLGNFAIDKTGELYTSGSYAPTHDTINLAGDTSPAVKAFYYLHLPESGIPRVFVVYKEMVHDSTYSAGRDFTDKASATAVSTSSQGDYIHITDGHYQGFYYVKESTGGYAELSDARWYLNSSNDITWDNGTVVFERWDGNGFGDDNEFIIADGDNYGTDLNGNDIKYGLHELSLGYNAYIPPTIANAD